MPDDYYASQYSGEEIDALLGGAGAGPVRYDVAQSLTDEQKAQARTNIWAAPSGGGVMESATEIAALSASESYDTFCAKLDAVLATMPSKSVTFLRVYPPQYYGKGSDMCALFKNTNDYASVYTIGSYNVECQGFRMIKHKRRDSDPAGQWDPLEYINPEMKLGVEYRTTERYQGKPVYAKTIDCGTVPLNTQKTVSMKVSGRLNKIRCNAWADSGADAFTIPRKLSGTEVTATAAGSANNIYISSNTDTLANYTIYATVYYTKATD